MSTQRFRLTPIGLFALVATLLAGVAVAPTPAHATTTLAPGDPTGTSNQAKVKVT